MKKAPRHSSPSLFRAATALVMSAALLASQSARAANTELDIVNGQTDLSASATYGGTAPTTTHDITFTNVTYSPAAFTVGSDISIGTLNDTSATALTIPNSSGSARTITLNGGSNSVSPTSTSDLIYGSGVSNLTITGGSGATALGLVLAASGNFDVSGGGQLTISSIISETGPSRSITKIGAGTLTLSGANTFTGGVTLSAGTLLVGANSTPTAAGSTVTSGPLGTGTLTLSGGTFAFANTGTAYTIANNVNVTAATNIETSGAGGINETVNGNWSGNGNLTLIANGTTAIWQFGGDNSGYTGTFTENSGNSSLQFNSASAGSAAAAWVFNNPTAQRTRLNFGNGTINFGSLSGNGSIANIQAGTTATMSVGALNTSTTFSGVIGDGTATVALTKVGNGTLTLSGAGGTNYTGTTLISAGTLKLGNVLAL